MDNNETTRRLRWALALDDRDAARLMTLGGLEASPERASAWRRRDDDPEREPCPDEAVAALLAGLVRERRGPAPAGAEPVVPTRVDNNAVLKALRIALALRAEDVAALVRDGAAARAEPGEASGGASGDAPDESPAPMLSAGEIGSLLRRPGTRNYRRCGDQVLRRFLVGLAARTRAGAVGDDGGDGADASARPAEGVR